MRIFIFEEVDKLTDLYHCGGGLVIIANNSVDAIKMIEDDANISLTEDEWNNSKSFELKYTPDREIFKFPDAGCC